MRRLIDSKNRGFTLVETALALVVLGIALTGVLSMLSTQQQRKIFDQQTVQLERIRQSLLRYAQIYGRLPCPDLNGNGYSNPKKPNTQGGACGRANVGGTHLLASYNQQRRVAVGFLPYKTLGVEGKNPYGHPYQYVVTLHYVDFEEKEATRFRDPTPFPYHDRSRVTDSPRCPDPSKGLYRPTFSVCSLGGVKVQEISVQGANKVLDEHAVLAVIDTGARGINSTLESAKKNLKFDGVNDQNTNSSSPYNKAFQSNRTVNVSDARFKKFDHKVLWLSSSDLVGAMLEAKVIVW